MSATLDDLYDFACQIRQGDRDAWVPFHDAMIDLGFDKLIEDHFVEVIGQCTLGGECHLILYSCCIIIPTCPKIRTGEDKFRDIMRSVVKRRGGIP